MYRALEQATGGGAPQPAESRIAWDGQAYTWPQFVAAYGITAQRCWDDAYERSIPRRIAWDGQAYTWTQYVEAYGDDAQRCWDEAAEVFDDSNASQLAVNAYAEPQPTAAIDEGAPHEAYAEPQRTAAIDEETPHEEAIQHKQNDSDASQLAVNANGEPQPNAAIDEGTPHEDAIQHDGAAASVNPAVASGAEQTTALMLALPSVCTFQEMQEMQPVKGMGGRVACAKQKELRQVCLENGVFEIDVTDTWPEWREVLRALPQHMQQLIIGNGIALVKFRLLEGSRDPNYAKNDSRERHVFDIFRVDTSAVHLHYHKNGSLDDPVLVAPIVMPQNANSGASQPAAPLIALSPSQPIIGRREAVLALTILLDACWNNGAGAVDITDGHAFDWKRFLTNTMENPEIAAMELEKVFALRTTDSGPPQLAFCTTGTRWKVMDPTQKTYKHTRNPALRNMSSNWRTAPLFLQAQTLGENWMRMR
jgi:hypothetical protein